MQSDTTLLEHRQQHCAESWSLWGHWTCRACERSLHSACCRAQLSNPKTQQCSTGNPSNPEKQGNPSAEIHSIPAFTTTQQRLSFSLQLFQIQQVPLFPTLSQEWPAAHLQGTHHCKNQTEALLISFVFRKIYSGCVCVHISQSLEYFRKGQEQDRQ